MSSPSSQTFGVLFKKLRLQAGIWTLKELGNLLAEKGIVYEDSLFSHWQAGRKIPLRREVLLSLVDLFWEKNATISLRELNLFLESASQGHLTDAELELLALTKKPPLNRKHRDWGDSPDVPTFFGRIAERELLEQWILSDACRLVSIVGMKGIGKTRLSVKLGKGGIGKTDLSLTLARGIESHFDFVIWRRLLNAPTIEELLGDIITFLSEQQDISQQATVDEQIARLLHYLRTSRCLIVLDNVETILQGGRNAGRYHPEYEAYGQLFEQIAQTAHQSCVLLTSREKTPEIARLETKTGPVRSLTLPGLGVVEAKRIFAEIGTFSGSAVEWQQVTQLYNGNPLALELAARHINEIFFGDIAAFLQAGNHLFSDLRSLLDWHFNRLSDAHKEVMYWLAINREPTAIAVLQEDILSREHKQSVSSTLQSLQRLVPLEKSAQRFTVQPVLIEYLTEKLIEQVVAEIVTGEIALLHTHALLKTSVADYVRIIQRRLILTPIIEKLNEVYKDESGVEKRLKELVSVLRKQHYSTGYTAGNIINLLIAIKGELCTVDCSHLPVWHAHLRGVVAQDVSFSHATFAKTSFTDTFGSALCVGVSPHGSVLAVGMATGEVRLWDVEQKVPLRTISAHTDWIWAVQFRPDGKYVASCGGDHTIRLWDTATGMLLQTFTGHMGTVYTISFSPDGQTLLSCSDDGTIRVWDILTGKLQDVLAAHTGTVYSVVFSPDGTKFASCGMDKTIKIWNTKDKKIRQTLEGHAEWIREIRFSPDGKIVVSSSGDKTVRVWEVATGQLIATLTGHTHWVWTVAVSPDGKTIASGSEDKTIRVWDSETGQCLKTLQGHASAVYSLVFHPQKNILISCGVDQTVRLWDMQHGTLVNTLQGYTNRAEIVAFTPDGKKLVSGHEDKTVRIWNVSRGELLRTLRGHTHWVWTVAVSPDGKLIASGSEDKTIRIWEASSGKLLHVLTAHQHWVYSVVFSPDGKKLISGGGDKKIRIWDVQTGTLLQTLSGHTHWVWTVAVNPDGKTIASGSYDQTVRIWDIQSGNCLKVLRGHTYWISCVSFSPDGQFVSSSSGDKTVRVWEVKTGKMVLCFTGHHKEVSSVSWHPDGKLIASASYDQTVLIWNSTTGKTSKVVAAHDHWVSSVAWSLDGKRFASGSYDGAIKVWDGEKRIGIRTMRIDRPYERMNITKVKGLTNAQKVALTLLGAVEE